MSEKNTFNLSLLYTGIVEDKVINDDKIGILSKGIIENISIQLNEGTFNLNPIILQIPDSSQSEMILSKMHYKAEFLPNKVINEISVIFDLTFTGVQKDAIENPREYIELLNKKIIEAFKDCEAIATTIIGKKGIIADEKGVFTMVFNFTNHSKQNN